MGLSILLLLSLCFPGLMPAGLAGQAPAAEESRREGSTLLLRCPYAEQQGPPQLRGWSRLTGGQWRVLVEIKPPQNSSTNQTMKGKLSIRDNSASRQVTIIMTNLQAEDSGSYSCTLRPPRQGSSPLLLKVISLNVFKEVHKWELDTISVQCKYRALEHRATPKVWCRRDASGCHAWPRANSTWAHSRALDGRVLIQDDPRAGIVTVTMRKLQAQDAGTYWCALQEDWQPARILEVRLFVSKRTQRCAARQSAQLSVSCLYEASEHRPASKAWCREAAGGPCTLLLSTEADSPGFLTTSQQGRVTIQDDSLQGIVTVTMGGLRAQDAGVYWCALREEDRLLRMAEVVLSVAGASNGSLLAAADSSQAGPAASPPAASWAVSPFLLLSVVLGTLLLLALLCSAALGAWWCKQLRRRDGNGGEGSCGSPGDVAQLGSTKGMEGAKDASNDLNYATLKFEAQPSPEGALYCNLEPGQAQGGPRAEDVHYASVGLQLLPATNRA